MKHLIYIAFWITALLVAMLMSGCASGRLDRAMKHNIQRIADERIDARVKDGQGLMSWIFGLGGGASIIGSGMYGMKKSREAKNGRVH